MHYKNNSMLFLFGKTLNTTLTLKYSLKKLYGINIFKITGICKNIGINPNTTLKNLNKLQLNKLIKYINSNIKIEQDLKKDIKSKIDNLINIKSYRGLRYSKGLPVHGQRTRTNAKNCKKKKL